MYAEGIGRRIWAPQHQMCSPGCDGNSTYETAEKDDDGPEADTSETNERLEGRKCGRRAIREGRRAEEG